MDRLRNLAKHEGVLEARLQRRLSAIVVAEMLNRVDLNIDGPALLIKGGSALELRLGLQSSRSSKDLDAVVRGTLTAFLTQAAKVVTEPLAGFTGRLERVREVNVPGMAVKPGQFDVKLQFKGKPFATVAVEVSAAEGNAAAEYDQVLAPPLGSLGIDDLPAIPCLSVRYQIAQKVHACTDPLSGDLVNTRARDLVDILLLEPLLSGDLAGLKAACVDVFSTRARHPWPPPLTVPPGWEGIYRQAATGLQHRVPADVSAAAEQVSDLISRVAAI